MLREDSIAAIGSSVAKSGLPFRTSPYGTGQPAYLSEDIARETIEKVFVENGFRLAPGFRYRKGDISFQTTGFDTDARVGYVWADWDSLDPSDAIIRWSDASFSKESIQRLIENTRNDPDDLKEFADYLVRRFEIVYKESSETHIEKVKSISDIPKRLEALSELYEKAKEKESDDKVSLREMNALNDDADDERDFIAVISQYQFAYLPILTREQREELQKAELARISHTAKGERAGNWCKMLVVKNLQITPTQPAT